MTHQDASGQPEGRPRASERLAAALGQPAPRHLSETEVRDFERRQDGVDAQIERIYGTPHAA